jgi:hypothetical protein
MWASYMPDTALIGQIWGNLAPEGSRYGKYAISAIKGAFLEC